ncbi:hypothetical protein D3C71_2138880 [compost metagenome]
MAVACDMTDNEVAATLNVSSRMVRKYVAQAMLCCMKLEARLTAGLAAAPPVPVSPTAAAVPSTP